jgi:HSP20 family molecular chaperone IbpA
MSSDSRRDGREERIATSEISTIHASGWNIAAACIEPLYNLMVGVTEVVLTIDLPFVNQNRVKLGCPADDVLEIDAETSRKITFRELGIKHRHGEFTRYHARIRMPFPIDETRMKKKFKRGVLEVHLPRLK